MRAANAKVRRRKVLGMCLERFGRDDSRGGGFEKVLGGDLSWAESSVELVTSEGCPLICNVCVAECSHTHAHTRTLTQTQSSAGQPEIRK